MKKWKTNEIQMRDPFVFKKTEAIIYLDRQIKIYGDKEHP